MLPIRWVIYTVALLVFVAWPAGVSPQVPTPCPQSVVFYSEFSPPYYVKQGYSFLANPFYKSQSAPSSATAANFYSSKGSPIDKTGQVRWVSAGLYVTCWYIDLPWPMSDRKVAQNEFELGHIENVGYACHDDSVEFVDYDPYDPDGDEDSSCGPGGGSGSDVDCRSEYVVVEISYDGGFTWSTLWEGFVTVCE